MSSDLHFFSSHCILHFFIVTKNNSYNVTPPYFFCWFSLICVFRYTDGNIRWVSQPGQNDTYDMQYPMTNYSQMESGIWPASFACLVIDLADHRWSAQPCDGLVSGFICQYETGRKISSMRSIEFVFIIIYLAFKL